MSSSLLLQFWNSVSTKCLLISTDMQIWINLLSSTSTGRRSSQTMLLIRSLILNFSLSSFLLTKLKEGFGKSRRRKSCLINTMEGLQGKVERLRCLLLEEMEELWSTTNLLLTTSETCITGENHSNLSSLPRLQGNGI